MQTQKLIVFLGMMSLFISSVSAQKVAEPKVLVDARNCLQPWLDSLEFIVKTDPDPSLKMYQQLAANRILATPADVTDKRAVRYISAAPEPKAPWIGLVPICSQKGLPSQWIKYLSEAFLLGQYDDGLNVIVLRSDIPAPKLLRGLVILHEMRHAIQSHYPIASENAPGYKLFKEVDAYEYEFGVLDHLNPPGYSSFLDDEVKRINVDYAQRGRSLPNEKDPRLTRIFTDLGVNALAIKSAASEIFLRANFALYDRSFPTEVALNKKMELMRGIGYK